jgi:hypothetical protein
MGWRLHLTQAAAMALARPFLRPSIHAEEDAADVVADAVVVDADTNAPPLGIALAYLKLLLLCVSSERRIGLFLCWILLLVLLCRGRDAAASTELRAADTCSTKFKAANSARISSTGSCRIVRVESRRQGFGMMDLRLLVVEVIIALVALYAAFLFGFDLHWLLLCVHGMELCDGARFIIVIGGEAFASIGGRSP